MKHHCLTLFLFCIIACNCLLYSLPPWSQSAPADSAKENKADYLEKIYFSGQNKEGLTTMIAATIQEFKGKSTTPAVARQYTFLSGIKDNAKNAENACDVLDLIAAGIYAIDIAEAQLQGIPKPNAKASGKAVGALESVSNFNNNLGSTAWSYYYLSGGSTKLFSATSKLSGAASAAGSVANSFNTGKQVFTQGKATLKSLGLIRDKACKTVPQKTIAIGEHVLPVKDTLQNKVAAVSPAVSTNNKTTVTITGIDYEKLSLMEQNIKACSNVKATLKKFNTAQSTIEVTHTGTIDELLNLMFQTCKSNFKNQTLPSRKKALSL